MKLPTLTYRRLRGDLIEAYKIVSQKYDAEVCSNMIKLRSNSVTRGNKNSKMYKEHGNLNLRLNSFPHRIVNAWNSLPAHVVSAPTIMSFERRVDKHLSSQDMIFDYKASLVKVNAGFSDTGSRNPVLDDIDLDQEA